MLTKPITLLHKGSIAIVHRFNTTILFYNIDYMYHYCQFVYRVLDEFMSGKKLLSTPPSISPVHFILTLSQLLLSDDLVYM